ncbi:MAG: acetate/propionate family kinase, partial [Gammaproteobacteria bacterium]|nr:acetate/propionate family kinase [Gammaproteobacteria bacterium]
SRLTSPCLIDAAVEREIEALTPLAPLHQPAALALIRAARAVPGLAVPQLAVFDTAFYRDMPAAAQSYALPAALREQHRIRRHGFHGLAHQAMLETWQQQQGSVVASGARVISLQLGAGCSVTASRGGRPVETSMGFSPLEGLVMATRSGDVDPGAMLYLLNHAGITPPELDDVLNRQSGLLGLSGISGNVSELLVSDSDAARHALEVYCHRITRYLGSCLAVLGGVDAILFGGGVGENVPEIRARVLATLGFAGIGIDPLANRHCRGKSAMISAVDAPVQVWVFPVNEALIMARAALDLLDGKAMQGSHHG